MTNSDRPWFAAKVLHPFFGSKITLALLLFGSFTVANIALTEINGLFRRAQASGAFTQGNLVIYRVGDGSSALSSAATPVFLDEYTTSGTLVQSIPLPTTVSGANKRLTASGTAASEGLMTSSKDGRYLTATGYDAVVGTASITTSASSTINRVIARVDSAGAIDTTTALTDAISGGNPRSAVSTNGADLWISGTSSGGGIRYAAFGATTSTALNTTTVTNLRQTNIFFGQLYVSSQSGAFRLAAVDSGTPTTGGQSITNLPGYPTSTTSPYGFFFADLNAGVPGVDTVYVADDNIAGGTGGIQKYSLVSGFWVANGSIALTAGLRGLTGSVAGSTVTLYVTGSTGTNGTLYTLTDSSGYNATITGSLTTLATAGTNKAFRGVAFAPVSGGPTNPSGVGTATPNTVPAGTSTLLTVAVTPGSNPTSSSLAVTGDLTSIGGSAAQQFFDDGTHGDATAGDSTFSFQATVSSGTTSGAKSLPFTVTDAQSRSSSPASISLTVPAPTSPTGVGAANPNTVVAGNSTLLTVAVTPGTSPISTGITVTGNLTSIGGSATQQFFDDGTHGDVTAGDNTFSFQATVSSGTSAGAKSLPASIADAQSRTGSATISLTVTAPSTSPSGTGAASPNAVSLGGSTVLTVAVTPGTNPTSTGITVTGDLTSIGGSAVQPFFDDGTHGDAVSGDSVFSFQATVANTTTLGGKSLLATISDAQGRSSSATIGLTVQPQTVPPGTLVISQVYGGGGNSGSTYTNDFIELYNRGTSSVNLAGWSVQYNSAAATTTWQVTPICPSGSCTIAPGHYFLVQESQGSGGTTPLPLPDATGAILMSATNAKVALVESTTALSGGCPASSAIIDLVGYGIATCFETNPTPALSNTTAAIRKGNGCVDTDNNAADLFIGGPIPRNSASPVNSCGGDPTNISGLGDSHPTSLDPASNVLLTVTVTPATTPPSTGINVSGDLTSIGGSALQVLYDDGTHGDVTAGDNVFSFQATVGAFVPTGVKSIVMTINDAQGRTATAPITLTVASPTCGVERWSIKTGTDPDAALVDLNSPVPTTISYLRAIPLPFSGDPPPNRVAPTETTVYVVNALLSLYKKEADVDYHIVLQDVFGNQLITEIPCPCCVGATSPFAPGVANARATFDSRLTATSFFQSPPVSTPVKVKGVGFFDFIHGQTGVAPNGIELHSVLDIAFLASTATTLTSFVNPSAFEHSITFSAAVTSSGLIPSTGFVTFRDGSTFLGVGQLNAFGMATFSTSSLSPGSHSITAEYIGDDNFGVSLGALTQTVVNNPPVAKCKNTTVSADSSCMAGASSTSVDDGSFDPDGNAITITQTPTGPYPVGNTTVTLTVTDSGGASSSCTAVVAVVDTTPPVVACPAGTVASADANCQAAVPNVVAGATASDNCTPAGSLTITQAPVAGTPVGLGVTTITVTAKDAANNIATCTTTFTVNDTTPPTITCPGNITRNNDQGQCSAVVAFQPSASDNCTGVTTICTPASGSAFAVGTTTVTCTATDAAGNHATCGFTVTVNDTRPPTIACPADITHGTDVNVSTAVVTFQPSVSDNCPGVTFACNPASGSSFNLGTTVVSCTATDASNNMANCSFRVTVVDTQPPSITCPPSQNRLNDPNQCGAAVTYADPVVTDNTPGATFVCNPPSHSFFPVGTTMVNCTATDSGGNHSSCSFMVTINDTQPPDISCQANVSVAGNIFGSCSANVSPGVPTASDNCPAVSVTGVRSDGLALTAPYPQGATTITWTARDASNNTASCQQTVTVTNPSPVVTITGPTSGAIFAVNTPVNFTGTFTDNLGGTHTATWMFDTISQVATVAEQSSSSPGTATATYTFTTAGVYLVRLTVNDGCGGVTTADTVGGLTAEVVIYDPSGGFVTGGGWIDSPVGAYAPDPSLTGKATFGFVSKYDHGATVPTGNTEFQFRAASLNFHSTAYEWLVVAGARAQYKGSGTINGAGDYGFILTAIDGDINGGGGVDKFRIKIWNKSGGGIIYDNQMNGPDTADPTTVLGGGSIVIHKM